MFGKKAEHVLITGATGFIGRALLARLLEYGHQVTILTRNPAKAAKYLDKQVQCIARMDDLPATQALDVVINLAGARILGWPWSAKRKTVLRNSRTTLTQQVVDWIEHAQKPPRLLLSASAIGYYGIQEQGDPTALSEDGLPQSIFMSQLCQDWEAAAHRATDYGVHVKCMRFGVVLGHGGPLPMMLLPIKLGLGGPLAGGQQCFSWIHLDDVVRAMAHLWSMQTHEAPFEAYNFTAPAVVTQKQFSQIAAQVLGRPCFIPTPGFPMRFFLGEQSDLLLEGQRVVPTRLKSQGFTFSYPDLQKALQSLY